MQGARCAFVALALIAVLHASPYASTSAQSGGAGHVVVVSQAVSGEYVNLTVTTYTKPGMIRSAGLFLNDSLVSNEVGGVWLSYDAKQVLPFRLRALTQRAELRIVYDYTQGTNATTTTQTTELTMPDAANVRPVSASVDANHNATIQLLNLGAGTAPRLLASLEDTTGAIIGDPYYQRLAPLVAGGEASLTFRVVDAPAKAHLVLEGAGHRAIFVVHLRAAAAAGSMRLTTDYPSLEAAPGGTAQFSLRLTNQGGERLVRLDTVGLPESFSPIITVGGRTVQTLQVPAGAVRDIGLTLHVPATLNLTEPTLTFEFVVLDSASSARLGSTSLSVTASGLPRLDLAGRNWNALLKDGRAELTLGIKNSGTSTAHNVALRLTPPPGWSAQQEPASVERIEPGQTADVKVVVTAPQGTSDGRYVVDVLAHGPGLTPSRERSLTIDVDQPAPSRLPWLLAVGVAGVATTVLLIRIRRR